MCPGKVSNSSCTSGYVIGYVCKWICKYNLRRCIIHCVTWYHFLCISCCPSFCFLHLWYPIVLFWHIDTKGRSSSEAGFFVILLYFFLLLALYFCCLCEMTFLALGVSILPFPTLLTYALELFRQYGIFFPFFYNGNTKK